MLINENERLNQKELASRMGISEKTFIRNKDRILFDLSDCYDYEVEYGKSNIYHFIKVNKEYTYDRKSSKKSQQRDKTYEDAIIETIQEQPLNTAMNVNRILLGNWQEVKDLGYTDSTNYENIKVRMRLWFGNKVEDVSAFDNKDRKGYIKEKVWCQLDTNNNRYVPLTQFEIDYFYGALGDALNNKDEEIKLLSDYDSGLISKSELCDAIGELKINKFALAKKTFKNKFGYYPIKVPYYELYQD